MASGRVKSIDEIKDAKEMLSLMASLDISSDGLAALDEMKARVRVELSQSKYRRSWSPGQAFSILSKAKDEDVGKRKRLMECYNKVERFLNTMDDKMLSSVQPLVGSVKEEVKQHKEQLDQSDYFLLVAGETSSGKSSLVNLILEEDILPSFLINTTSTICEIKYGEVRKIVVHFKDKDPKTGQVRSTETVYLDTPTGSTGSPEQSYCEQITPYVTGEKCSTVKKIELFWPHSVLEKGLVIVDSPGVGESDDMDQTVIQYLPEAFAFIYVINTPSAGGVQKHIREKLFEKAKKAFEVKKDKDGEMSSELLLLSKCALFVCNKWECVPEKEIEMTKDKVITKLTTAWPGVNPEAQILYMSVNGANTARKYGIITESFFSLMDGMRSVITKSIDPRLELHWLWLDDLLSWIIRQAKLMVDSALQDRTKLKQKIAEISNSLDSIENDKDKIVADIHKCLEKCEDDAVQRLSKYLSSEDVKARFTSWTEKEVPKEGSSWEETEENIRKALSSRFHEIIKQWEEDNKVFANIPIFLLQQFQKYYDDVEGQLQDLSGAFLDDHGHVDRPEKDTSWPYFSGAFQAVKYAAAFGFASLFARSYMICTVFPGFVMLAEPYAVKIFKGMKDRWISRPYRNDKAAFMAHESKNYLAIVTNQEKLKECVENLLKPGKQLLENIGPSLQRRIQADKKLLQQLGDQTSSKKEEKDVYQKIQDEGCQHKSNLALIGIKDAIKISCEELKWREEMSSRLGSGTFGDVYQGTMERQGRVKIVALKVLKQNLGVTNASQFVNELKNLRLLNHPHIVQFYGFALLQNEDDTERMILVMEKCKGNLKSHIFKGPESVPGKSEDPSVIGEVCRWAEEITDGLSHIHAMRVVHRDLKLENILLSEDNSVKIADVGVAKLEADISGTRVGTNAYMAPEVSHSERYDRKADIYSLGIVLWEMWYGQQAFANVPSSTLSNWVDNGIRPVDTKGYKKPPIRWEHLMTQCWKGDPKERPTAEECHKETTSWHSEFSSCCRADFE